MNLLAHALLSGADPMVMVGGFAGDFFKGRLDDALPEKLHKGLLLHRLIDQWTDERECTIRAKFCFPLSRRRYAGSFLDMLIDHFLALHWESFSHLHLDDFAEQIYQRVEEYGPWLPAKLVNLLPRIREKNWLVSYQRLSIMPQAFFRIGERIGRGEEFRRGGGDLLKSYVSLERYFWDIFPAIWVLAMSCVVLCFGAPLPVFPGDVASKMF